MCAMLIYQWLLYRWHYQMEFQQIIICSALSSNASVIWSGAGCCRCCCDWCFVVFDEWWFVLFYFDFFRFHLFRTRYVTTNLFIWYINSDTHLKSETKIKRHENDNNNSNSNNTNYGRRFYWIIMKMAKEKITQTRLWNALPPPPPQRICVLCVFFCIVNRYTNSKWLFLFNTWDKKEFYIHYTRQLGIF